MENFYKVVKIQDKGFGCVALQDIKIGTLILIDHAKCVAQQELKTEGLFYEYFESQIESFLSMSQNDQEEFLKLHNRFEDSNTFSNDDEADYFLKLKQFSEIYSFYNDPGLLEEFDENLALIVLGIYATNSFPEGVGIKISRFNHSCRPNTFQEPGSEKIRAISNIEPGQEITVDYARAKVLFNMLSKEMRQWFLRVNFNVTNCFCDLCEEDADGKSIVGSKMDKLVGELELLAIDMATAQEGLFSLWPFPADANFEKLTTDDFTPEKCRRQVDLCKELYKLGKERKDQTITLYCILNMGYLAAHFGILMVWKGPKKQMAEGFKNDCISFCKAIETFGKLLGKQLVKPKKWRKLHQDYDKHLEIFGVKLS